jgi:hypothetical protein
METQKQSNTTIYIALATIIVLIIGGVGFFTSKSLSNKPSESLTGDVKLNVASPYAAPEFTGIDAWINSKMVKR